MQKQGISTIIILLIVLASVIVIGGVFYYVRPAKAPTISTTTTPPTNQATSTQTSTGTPSSTTPIIWSLDPKNGPVGTVVTIHGAEFAATNTVMMDSLVAANMKNIASTDGKTLTFTIPTTLGPSCNPGEMCAQFLLEVTPNTYPIVVMTDGATHAAGTFTVTAK